MGWMGASTIPWGLRDDIPDPIQSVTHAIERMTINAHQRARKVKVSLSIAGLHTREFLPLRCQYSRGTFAWSFRLDGSNNAAERAYTLAESKLINQLI